MCRHCRPQPVQVVCPSLVVLWTSNPQKGDNVTVMTVTCHITYRLRPWNIVASKTDSLFSSQTLTWNILLTIIARLYPLIRQSLTVVYLPIQLYSHGLLLPNISVCTFFFPSSNQHQCLATLELKLFSHSYFLSHFRQLFEAAHHTVPIRLFPFRHRLFELSWGWKVQKCDKIGLITLRHKT